MVGLVALAPTLYHPHAVGDHAAIRSEADGGIAVGQCASAQGRVRRVRRIAMVRYPRLTHPRAQSRVHIVCSGRSRPCAHLTRAATTAGLQGPDVERADVPNSRRPVRHRRFHPRVPPAGLSADIQVARDRREHFCCGACGAPALAACTLLACRLLPPHTASAMAPHPLPSWCSSVCPTGHAGTVTRWSGSRRRKRSWWRSARRRRTS